MLVRSFITGIEQVSEKPIIDRLIPILVVDDYALTRVMVQSILKGLGFSNITQADSGEAALKKLQDEDYKLVICDWNMPGGSGITLLKRVRAQERNKNVLFLMLTAEGTRRNVDEAVEAGVSSFVVKPFTADVLIEKVEFLLGGTPGGKAF